MALNLKARYFRRFSLIKHTGKAPTQPPILFYQQDEKIPARAGLLQGKQVIRSSCSSRLKATGVKSKSTSPNRSILFPNRNWWSQSSSGWRAWGGPVTASGIMVSGCSPETIQAICTGNDHSTPRKCFSVYGGAFAPYALPLNNGSLIVLHITPWPFNKSYKCTWAITVLYNQYIP